MDIETDRYGMLDDIQMVQAILGGDERALQYLLVEMCGSRFKALCHTARMARMEPDDLAQEICLMLFKNDWAALRAFRGENSGTGAQCSLKGYVFVCAARLIRKKAERLASEIDWTSALSDEDGNWIDVPDEKQAADVLKMAVLEAVTALDNPNERLVIIEYKLRGRSPAEVAALLQLSGGAKGTEANVYQLACRAMKNLRETLEKGDIYA
jgi:RNA polymerase sigma factor (sigma-70 family)